MAIFWFRRHNARAMEIHQPGNKRQGIVKALYLWATWVQLPTAGFEPASSAWSAKYP